MCRCYNNSGGQKVCVVNAGVIMVIVGFEEEYEKGMKEKSDEYEMKEEKTVMEKGGFKIISVSPSPGAKLSDEEETVFARATSRFYNTMAKAQGQFVITEVHLICNADTTKRFKKKVEELKKAGLEVNEEWAFHGTSRTSIQGIAKTGFVHPDHLKKAAGSVKVLDSGFFGKGIYFSYYSDYAMWYSNARYPQHHAPHYLVTNHTTEHRIN